MEIPIINRMSNFDDPSVLSRLFPISQISQPFSLWKWGALILALLATFTSIINRTKILIIRLRKRSSLAAQPLHSEPDDGGFSDSEDDTCSSISSDDDDDAEPMSQIEDDKNVRVGYCEDEPQSHKTKLRRCRSIGDRLFLSELTNGKSVVKLWDGLSLDNSCGSLVSIYDLNKDLNKSSFFGGTHRFPSVSVTSPAVVVSTMTGNAMNTALRVWDTRVGRQIPAIFAEWRPQMGKRVSISTGGIEKVYVRDDVTGELTVGDMRNASSPLQNVTECDGGTWWDADAVMVYKDYVDQWAESWAISMYYACQRTWKPFNPILGETYELTNHGGIKFIAEQISHHPPISAAHAENEHFAYDITSKLKTKFLGNSLDVYPLGRTRVTLKRDGVVLDLVPPATKVNNLIFGRTWVDSPGEMIMTNLTTGDKVVLYFQPCGWFGAGRYEVDGYVYNAAEEPKILISGKWNESMNYQPCDLEGEPLPGSEQKEVWRVADVPENDKFQFTYFAHKINSFETAPRKLLASDSRLRPDRYALEKGDLSKSGSEKNRLEEKQRAEKRNREAQGHQFTPRWFDITSEISPTPWGDLEVCRYNGKYSEYRASVDSSDSIEEVDVSSTEFNPWQYGNSVSE